MSRERFLSVVIPNHNGAGTIAKCLEAAFSSEYDHFEVVVVDDYSSDASVEIIKGFPCRLIQLEEHAGVSKARNRGAKASCGDLLFFIDNDCLLQKDTLALANRSYGGQNGHILGGTYTDLPYDRSFYSIFQSVFINHFETKKTEPDYIAAHSMIIDSELFRKSGGFVEDSFIGVAASVEDVEFCHRLRRAGNRLCNDPEIQVQHIFNFSLIKSLMNASKKSRYWTMYSLMNKDLLVDSGTASIGLKANVGLFFLSAFFFLFYLIKRVEWTIILIPLFFLFNFYINRGLLGAFFKAKGFAFSVAAMCYYCMIYPVAVGTGALVGAVQYLWNFKVLRKSRP